MKKYSSIISIALLFAFVSTSDAQGIGSKGSKEDPIIRCLKGVGRLASSDYYLVQKASKGKKLSGKEGNRLADLAAKHCGKSEKSSGGSAALGSSKKVTGGVNAKGAKKARGGAVGDSNGKLGRDNKVTGGVNAKGAKKARGGAVGDSNGKLGRDNKVTGGVNAKGEKKARGGAVGDGKIGSDDKKED